MYLRLFRQVVREICGYLGEVFLPLLEETSLSLFHCLQSFAGPEQPLDKTICCDVCSRYLLLEENLVLCTGSKLQLDHLLGSGCRIPHAARGNEAYLIRLDRTPHSVTILPSMTSARCSHGLLSTAGVAYVFAGCIGYNQHHPDSQNSPAERLVLSIPTAWEPICGNASRMRFNFTPTAHEQKVYLCGGTAHRSIDVFSLATQRFLSSLPVLLPEMSATLSYMVGSSLVIVTARHMIEVAVESMSVRTEACNVSVCFFPAVNLVAWGGSVYVVNAHSHSVFRGPYALPSSTFEAFA